MHIASAIAWPRVLPEGRGAINAKGLDSTSGSWMHCSSAVSPRARPCITGTCPRALEAEGGWLTRATADAFAEYAAIVGERLGDRVALWLTHNERLCQAFLGYEHGLFAPGQRDLGQALSAAHHLLVSHGSPCRRCGAACGRLSALRLTSCPPPRHAGESRRPGSGAAGWRVQSLVHRARLGSGLPRRHAELVRQTHAAIR